MIDEVARDDPQPLLSEWASLGILYTGPAHGFAIASRLKPDGDVGRVWSVSRPLTYRALDQLTAYGYIAPVSEEPGVAGGNRTILAATRLGRARFRRWLSTPVEHLRDLRSELLLKLVLAQLCDIDVGDMLERQRRHVRTLADGLAAELERRDDDVVVLWRHEIAHGALRFLDRLLD